MKKLCSIDKGRAGERFTNPSLMDWMFLIYVRFHSLYSPPIPTLEYNPFRMSMVAPWPLDCIFHERTISHLYNARTTACIVRDPKTALKLSEENSNSPLTASSD